MNKNITLTMKVGTIEIIKGLCTVDFRIRTYFKSGSFVTELSDSRGQAGEITHSTLYDLLSAAEEVKLSNDTYSIIMEMGNGIRICAWDKRNDKKDDEIFQAIEQKDDEIFQAIEQKLTRETTYPKGFPSIKDVE